jgi:hypothetical protein
VALEVAVAEALEAFHIAQSAGNPSASRHLAVLRCRETEADRALSDLQMFLEINLALSGGGFENGVIIRAGGGWRP